MYFYINKDIYTIKKPHSRHALPRSLITLDFWSGLPEVSKEKSIVGISSSLSETISLSWFRGKTYDDGTDLTQPNSTSCLTDDSTLLIFVLKVVVYKNKIICVQQYY